MPAPEPPRAPPDAITIGALLRWGAGALGSSQSAALDARVLMKAAASLDDASLILNEREVLPAGARDRFAAMIARRAHSEPVAHITGVREFWSLPIAVEPGILVPRPESETLVSAILGRRAADARWRILDLGCGSGALLCALLAAMPNATGLGVDISEAAVALTQRNLAALGLAARGRPVCGDWTAPVSGRFDIILSNPPYIADSARGSLPSDVEAFEDPRALFAGPEGLDAYRALARQLPAVAAGGGLVALELGAGQAESVSMAFREAFPHAPMEACADLAGIVRVLIIDLAEGAR